MKIRRALFESWRGRYGDSPRAISEAMATRWPQVKQTWVASGETTFPDSVKKVERHSVTHFAKLFSTQLLVTNDIVTRHFVKGPDVTHVQCWHGTPLKAIGHDEKFTAYHDADGHRKRFDRDVRTWDYLISPSPACTEIFRGAFNYEGRVLEIGYPRNDVLSLDDGTIRNAVRDSLGIAEHTTAILYAPTWRDDALDPAGRYAASALPDFEALRDGLDDTVILTRMHANVTQRPASKDGFTIDVSDGWDIAELYLAADALISDYSSAIFDFAVTGKPIICHAPDLDHYRSELRPMYFEYETWAPGPITTTDDELVAALQGLSSHGSVWAESLTRFRETFCPHEDGHATQRLLDVLAEELRW